MTVSTIVSRSFGRFGVLVHHHPALFICLPLLLSAFSLHPLISALDKLQNERRPFGSADLFSPIDSLVNKDRDRIADVFPDGGYFSDRTFLASNIRIVMVDTVDGNIFDSRTIRFYAKLRGKLEKQKVFIENHNISYSILCGRPDSVGHCRPDPIVLLNELGSTKITHPYANMSFGPLSRLVNLGPLLGDVSMDDGNHIERATVARMVFDFPPTTNYTELDMLENEWTKLLSKIETPDRIRLHFWSPTHYENDMKTIGQRTSNLVPLLISALSAFSILSAFNCQCDLVSAKPLLALSGVFSASIAIGTSIGLLHVLRFQLIQIAMLTPFLVLSIGIDDMFIMLSVWKKVREEHREASCEKLVKMTYEESSVSILLTTLGNVLVYGTGALSSFPAVRLFCVYCCFSLFIVYIFQMMFFGAFLSLDAKRELSGRHPITFRRVEKEEESMEKSETSLSSPPYSTVSSTSCSSSFSSLRAIRTDDACARAGSALVSLLVGASYLFYIVFSVYQLSFNVRTGLEVSSLLPSDTKTFEYLRVYERAFAQFNTPMELLIDEDIDYSNLTERNRVLAAVATLELTHYTMRAQWWLSDFRTFMDSELNLEIPNDPESFTILVKNVFLEHPLYRNYAKDVTFSNNRINASRLFLPLRNVNVNTRLSAYRYLSDRLRFVLSTYRIHFIPFDVSFTLAEQAEKVPPLVVENMVWAGFATIFSVILLVPSVLNCVLMTWAVLSINAGVFAILVATGSRLDVVSAITSLLSVGYSVDFSSHVLAHYHSFRKTRKDPLASTLSVVALPILHSSLSTILGVLCVSPVPGYVSFSFIHTVIAVCCVGAYHSLVLVPCILRLIE